MYEIIKKYRIKKPDNYEVLHDYDVVDDENILSEDIFNKITKDNELFLIVFEEKLLGFFSLATATFLLNGSDTSCVKINYLYIFEKYRLCGLATEILNDITWVIHNFNHDVHYVLANTNVESCMFYLNNGFKLFKIKKKKNRRNILIFCKKI